MSRQIKDLGNITRLGLFYRVKLFFILIVIGLVLSSCSGIDPIIPPKINHDFARDFPAWTEPKVQSTDNRDLKEGALIEGDTTYDCTVETKQLDPAITTYKDIMLAGINEDVLYPGALLQGDDIEKGLLRSVRLDRSPITMTISLNVGDRSITVDNPTTATMSNAVSELIRRADTRLGAIDVVPGNVFFNKIEAHSFQQSLNQVGISAGYDNKIGTKVDASFNYGSDRKASSHTIMVYLVEPLFKISFSEDDLKTPDDLLGNSVTAEDIQGETDAGRMGPDNLPVYVKTVTYGRIMMYTLTSTEVDNFERLQAAVSGSYNGFTGEAEYSQEDRDIITNSKETLIAFGGSQEASKAAISDLNKFFVPIEATQTVPISYEIRDVKGNVASIGDITEYKVQNCAARDKPVKKKVVVSFDNMFASTDCDSLDIGNLNEYKGQVAALGIRARSYSKNLTPRSSSSSLGISAFTRTYTSPAPGTTFTVSANATEEDGTNIFGTRLFDNLGSDSNLHSIKPASGSLNLNGDGCGLRIDYSISVTDVTE